MPRGKITSGSRSSCAALGRCRRRFGQHQHQRFDAQRQALQRRRRGDARRMQHETGVELALREGLELHVAGGLAQFHRDARVRFAKGPQPRRQRAETDGRHETEPDAADLAAGGVARTRAQRGGLLEQLAGRLHQRGAGRRQRHAAARALEQRPRRAAARAAGWPASAAAASCAAAARHGRSAAPRPRRETAATCAARSPLPGCLGLSYAEHINTALQIDWTHGFGGPILRLPAEGVPA